MPSFTTAFFLETVALCWMNGDKGGRRVNSRFATAFSSNLKARAPPRLPPPRGTTKLKTRNPLDS